MNFKRITLKLTSFLLIAVMLCCCLPVASIADDDDAEYMTKKEAAKKIEKSELFSAVHAGLKSCEEVIDLRALKCTDDEMYTVWLELYHSGDLFHHYSGEWDFYYSKEDRQWYVNAYYPYYYWDLDETKEKVAEYNELLSDLLALGSKSWSDLEIVLFYHDYLVANYAYDTGYDIYDAYGFLKEGKGLAQSYTMVFEEIMDHYGIPCTYAQSDSLSRIWNVVYLDGYWYHLDLTHDDPLRKKADIPGCVSKKYFLIGEDQMEDYLFDDDDDEDIVCGCDVIPAKDDHPCTVLWSDTARSPAVYYRGDFYSVFTSGKKAYLGKLDPEEYSYEALVELPFGWSAPNGAMYTGSYTTLCTYGNLIYYNTTTAVCSYNPQTGEIKTLKNCNIKKERIYALKIEDGVLKAYTAATVEAKLTDYFTVELPALPGDLDHNGTLTIADVTETLTLLSDGLSHEEITEADVDGDGKVNISDVTVLLNILAGPHA